MNFNMGDKFLPHPNNIMISSPKQSGELLLLWDAVPEAKGYNVYYGYSPSGIFYKANQTMITNTRYIHKIGNHPQTVYYFKVSTIDLNDNEGQASPNAFYQIPTTHKWFKKANERTIWILRQTGEPFDVYTRKTEGKKCRCWDENRGQSATPNCVYCFGTGFDGGFDPQFKLFIRKRPAQQDLGITGRGLVLNNTPTAWTLSPIVLKNRDLLIDPHGRRYTILNTNLNHAAGYIFHQEFSLKELDPTDILYKVKPAVLEPVF